MKESINKMKRSTGLENIFANDKFNKRLISKIYKEHRQLNIKIKFKMGRGSEQTFFWRRHTDDQQVHEKGQLYQPFENSNQNHNEIFLHTCQMAIIKKTTNHKCWHGCKEIGILV